ncbi:amino acid ABC transporter permease [Salidesulfovibrio onnuriiensis]|uniref:amino acid ABC transporter permease n=1 Tax=Salidesulfovibrio onnuriiensis TaxID=2583823 RepID=UPI0011C75DCA|nr:amino acid ABC transporter permease [Salidesulfovibrio onnuriiensis]
MRRGAIRFTRLDAVLLLLVLGAGAFVLHRASVGLEYHWKWSVIPQFILWKDAASGQWFPGMLLKGLFTTLRLSLWSGLLATLIGIAAGLLRVSPRLFWRQLSGTYVGLVRNTPPLVIVFVFYFFIGDQIMNALGMVDIAYELAETPRPVLEMLLGPTEQLPQLLSAIITIALFEGAYIAEIVRAGIESVETGQWEASCALGFTRFQQMTHIILPQALQRMLPALAGQFISTVKDSAIVAVISIQELTFQGLQLMTTTYRTFETWITILAMYFVLTLLCSLLVRRLELRMARKA